MVLEKTPEYKKIVEWQQRVLTWGLVALTLTAAAGALYTRSTRLYAAFLIMLSIYAFQFVKIVDKMQLFKHGPKSLQKRFLDSVPVALLSIGCALALIG